MIKHKRIYINFFDYLKSDWIGCENCGSTSTEIHHLQFKSLGGTDVIENLMALCRTCHDRVHNIDPEFNQKLKEIHRNKLDAWRNTTGK